MKVKKYDSNQNSEQEQEHFVVYHHSKEEQGESPDNPEEEVTELIESNIKLNQIIPIVIYLGILLLFNVMTFFSGTFANWIIQGEFLIDIVTLLGLIINIAMILLLILFIMYLPKLTKPKLNQIGMVLVGILIGLLYYLIFVNNNLNLILGNIEFSFFNLILIIPIIITLTIVQIRKDMHFASNLSILLLGMLSILIILDIPNYSSLINLINYPYLFSIIIIFTILSIFYILKGNQVKIKIGKTDRVIKMKIIKDK